MPQCLNFSSVVAATKPMNGRLIGCVITFFLIAAVMESRYEIAEMTDGTQLQCILGEQYKLQSRALRRDQDEITVSASIYSC